MHAHDSTTADHAAGASLPAADASTPGAVLRLELQAAYRELAALERHLADLRADLDRQRQRVTALERVAYGEGQQ